ncbi:MAG: hypothetical protein LBK61_10500 [Spirochaetaceae bacterium]|nr:hypothetical protein [Spirochaetaceae bacterium]
MRIKGEASKAQSRIKGKKARHRNKKRSDLDSLLRLLMVYVITDKDYGNGRIRYFQGRGFSPKDVEAPLSTLLWDIIDSADMDIELIPYLKDGLPRILVCIVSPHPNDPQGKSDGRYFVIIPTVGTDAITWSVLGNKTKTGYIQMYDETSESLVLGNPTGLAQYEGYLYLSEYDSAKIYRLDLQGFEDAITGTETTPPADEYTVLDSFDAAGIYPNYHPATPLDAAVASSVGITLVDRIHGVGLNGLYNGDDGATYLYTQINYVQENKDMDFMPVDYYPSLFARVKLNVDGTFDEESAGAVMVGKNAVSAVAGFPGLNQIAFLISCLGGCQNNGFSNGADSMVCKIDAFSSEFAPPDDPEEDEPSAAPVAITGAVNTQTQLEDPELDIKQYFDMKNMFILDNGDVYLFTGTYGHNWTFWWRLFKTTLTYVLNCEGVSIDVIADDNPDFVEIDSGYGTVGSFMEVTGSNIAQRVWTVLGSVLKVSEVADYSKHVTFGPGVLYGEPRDEEDEVLDGRFNCGCMITDMIAAHEDGHSFDYRMVKGRHLAKIAAQRMALSKTNNEK